MHQRVLTNACLNRILVLHVGHPQWYPDALEALFPDMHLRAQGIAPLAFMDPHSRELATRVDQKDPLGRLGSPALGDLSPDWVGRQVTTAVLEFER